jgi:cell fate regulator YaaT (PSP1 superfamily)
MDEAPDIIKNQDAVYRVKIIHSSVMELYIEKEGQEDGTGLKSGDLVVVPTRYGMELGRVLGDLDKYEDNKAKEEQALNICREKIADHNLSMKLVNAHYLMYEPKILFFFTADTRIDFRELVKDLVAVFRIRIELRQIGVRDEARVLGGMGVCGRYYCCHGITDKLKPVSIKMAKEQNLTLNSMKISGPCGRLLCCLSYEYDTYREIKKKLPPEGTRLNWEKELFKVIEINLFKKMIRLAGGSDGMIELGFDRFTFNAEQKRWTID